MAAPPTCPSCNTPLALFTPREAQSHVNACLDLQQRHDTSASTTTSPPTCGICQRDLSAFTETARIEHANRCADSVLPLVPPPTRPRPRRQNAANNSTTAANIQNDAKEKSPIEVKCDARVLHLLQMLGLQRYAKKFAAEEIDLVALRLLSDDDLAALSIPEAARRRLAQAMHSVPILAQLQRMKSQPVPPPTAAGSDPPIGQEEEKEAEDHIDDQEDQTFIAPTQKFQESRVGARLKRSVSVAIDDDDDEVYVPTQPPSPIPVPVAKHPDEKRTKRQNGVPESNSNQLCDTEAPVFRKRSTNFLHDLEDDDDVYVPSPPSPPVLANDDLNEGTAKPDGKQATVSVKLPCQSTERLAGKVNEKEHAGENQKVSFRNRPSTSSSSAVPADDCESISSLTSDLGELDQIVISQSQISIERMLSKWKCKLIERERQRHEKELKRIETLYSTALMKRSTTFDDFEKDDSIQNSPSQQLPEFAMNERDQDKINESSKSAGVNSDDQFKNDHSRGDKGIIDLTQDARIHDDVREENNEGKRVEQRKSNENTNIFVISSAEIDDSNHSAKSPLATRYRQTGNTSANAFGHRSENSSSSSSASPIDFHGIERMAAALKAGRVKHSSGGAEEDTDHLNERGEDDRQDVSNGGVLQPNRPVAGYRNDENNRGLILSENNADDDDSDFEQPPFQYKKKKLKSTVQSQRKNEVTTNQKDNRDIGRQDDNEKHNDEEDSDDEIMDLMENDEDDINGFQNEFGHHVVEAVPTQDDEAGEEESAEAEFESRLKKKRKGSNSETTGARNVRVKKKKVTHDDMTQAIQKDEKLHEKVLMMECVEFGQFMKCMKEFNVNASKRALHDFLVNEGVMFKGDPPTNLESTQQFMRTLNTDTRDVMD